MEIVSFKRPFKTLPIETMAARFVRRSFKPHAHGEYMLGVITAGVHSVWSHGERHHASAGSIVTMHPGDVHHGGPGEEAGWSQRMVYIEEEALRGILGAKRRGAPSFPAPFHYHPELAVRLARLHDAAHRSVHALSRETALLLVARLVAPMAGIAEAAPAFRACPTDKARRMIDYLHAHIADDVTLSELGAVAGLGRRQTIDAFKQYAGLSPHAYHLGLKVRLVQSLLRGGAPLAQAALDAGFADQSHMARHFTAIIGATPGVFARSVA